MHRASASAYKRPRRAGVNIHAFNNVLNLRKFRRDTMRNNPTVMLVGKRGSGKTFTADYLLYAYRKAEMSVIVSPSEKSDPYWKRRVPAMCLKDKYKTETIYRSWVAHQNHVRACVANGYRKPQLNMVFDDCMYAKNIFNHSEEVREMVLNGRHDGLNFFCMSQYFYDVVKSLRNNFDYIVLFNIGDEDVLKGIHKNYVSSIPFNVFRETFIYYTRAKKYCLVIDANADTAEAMITFMRVPFGYNSKYRLCPKHVWRYDRQQRRAEAIRRRIDLLSGNVNYQQFIEEGRHVPMSVLKERLFQPASRPTRGRATIKKSNR